MFCNLHYFIRGDSKLSLEKNNFNNYAAYFIMAALIFLVQLLALFLSQPMNDSGMQAFTNPNSAANSIYYFVFLLVFTLLLLIAMKKNLKWVIKLVLLFAVASTIYYVFIAILALIIPSSNLIFALSVILSVGFTILMYKYPEWYVIDIVGLIIAAGASAIFGISLSIVPVLILLILLAIYDAISVYKTKHMITLADGFMDLKLPILFIIPKKLNYSFINDTFDQDSDKERGAFLMGLGDAVIPTILVISSNLFLHQYNQVNLLGFSYPTLFTIIGIFIGYIALMIYVIKGKPQAGLPFLNTGAILGFFVGILIGGVPISSFI